MSTLHSHSEHNHNYLHIDLHSPSWILILTVTFWCLLDYRQEMPVGHNIVLSNASNTSADAEAENCPAGVQGIQPFGPVLMHSFPKEASEACSTCQQQSALDSRLLGSSCLYTAASIKHLIHGCMICCSSILVGVKDLRAVKDEEASLHTGTHLRKVPHLSQCMTRCSSIKSGLQQVKRSPWTLLRMSLVHSPS